MSPLEKMARAYEALIAGVVGSPFPSRDMDNVIIKQLCTRAMNAALKTLSEDEVKACMAMVRAD